MREEMCCSVRVSGQDVPNFRSLCFFRTPSLKVIKTTPLRAVVAAHASAAAAPTPEAATPAVAARAPPIGATAVASAPLGSAFVLRILTPVVRVVVVRRGKREWDLRDLGEDQAQAQDVAQDK